MDIIKLQVFGICVNAIFSSCSLAFALHYSISLEMGKARIFLVFYLIMSLVYEAYAVYKYLDGRVYKKCSNLIFYVFAIENISITLILFMTDTLTDNNVFFIVSILKYKVVYQYILSFIDAGLHATIELCELVLFILTALIVLSVNITIFIYLELVGNVPIAISIILNSYLIVPNSIINLFQITFSFLYSIYIYFPDINSIVIIFIIVNSLYILILIYIYYLKSRRSDHWDNDSNEELISTSKFSYVGVDSGKV